VQGKTGEGQPDGGYRDVDAEAKMMDAETRRQELELKAMRMGVDIQKMREDSEHREADRVVDIHHRKMDRQSRSAVDLAKSLQKPQAPEAE